MTSAATALTTTFAARLPIPFQQQTDQLAELLNMPAGDVQNAFWTILVGAVCATCCALVGCFLVLRRMSLLGDALSHSVLAGTAGVYLITGSVEPIPMLLGALVAGVLTAVLTRFVHQNANVPEDSSIGIVFTSLFAFGVVVVSQAKGVHLDLNCVLFGDLSFAGVNHHPVLGVLWPESFQTLIPSLILTSIFIFVLWKELRLTSFDATFAVTIGFQSVIMHYLLTTIVAVVTVSAMEVVGLLVVALLIVPAATARLLTDRLSSMLVLACLIGMTSTTLGYLLALRWNSSAAGLTAVMTGVFLMITILLSPKNGILGRINRTVRLRIRICAEDVLAGLFRRQERADEENRPIYATPDDCRTFAGNGVLAGPAVRWLKNRQLVAADGNGVYLTDVGSKYARSLVRAHRLWETYLAEHFDLTADHLHDPAEEMEHFIGPDMQQRITEELAAPDEDPHGRIIPDPDDRIRQ